jgi:ribosomal protein L9
MHNRRPEGAEPETPKSAEDAPPALDVGHTDIPIVEKDSAGRDDVVEDAPPAGVDNMSVTPSTQGRSAPETLEARQDEFKRLTEMLEDATTKEDIDAAFNGWDKIARGVTEDYNARGLTDEEQRATFEREGWLALHDRFRDAWESAERRLSTPAPAPPVEPSVKAVPKKELVKTPPVAPTPAAEENLEDLRRKLKAVEKNFVQMYSKATNSLEAGAMLSDYWGELKKVPCPSTKEGDALWNAEQERVLADHRSDLKQLEAVEQKLESLKNGLITAEKVQEEATALFLSAGTRWASEERKTHFMDAWKNTVKLRKHWVKVMDDLEAEVNQATS